MLHFVCMFQLLYGPLADGSDAVIAPASELFARVESMCSLRVERAEPELDSTAVRFREASVAEPGGAEVILMAHGIYLHETLDAKGAPIIKATRDATPPPRARPRMFFKVYAPVHVQPEDLLERLAAANAGRGVDAQLEPRTGKIVLRAAEEAALTAAVSFLQSLDTPSEGSGRFRAFRCRDVKASAAEAELLRLLPKDVRARVTVVVYEKINVLMISADRAQWDMIAGILAKIDPKGETL